MHPWETHITVTPVDPITLIGSADTPTLITFAPIHMCLARGRILRCPLIHLQ